MTWQLHRSAPLTGWELRAGQAPGGRAAPRLSPLGPAQSSYPSWRALLHGRQRGPVSLGCPGAGARRDSEGDREGAGRRRSQSAGRAPLAASGGGGLFRRAPGAAAGTVGVHARGSGRRGRHAANGEGTPGPRVQPAGSVAGSPPLVRPAHSPLPPPGAGPGRGRGWGGRASRAGEAERAVLSGGRGLNRRSHPRPGQVSEDELVSTLKHVVSEKLNIPVRQQRLLFKGKALAGNGERKCPGSPAGGRRTGCPGRARVQCDGWGGGALTVRSVAEPPEPDAAAL